MRQGALAVLIVLAFASPAAAAAPPLGADGRTAPVYDYAQAVRERIFIPQPGIDQDRNGVADRITIDIIRPQESGPANRMPAIVDPGPYFTTLCRGQRDRVPGRRRRRRRQRPLADVRRQLLPPARLRVRARADERHGHHHRRLPAPWRRGGHRGGEVGDRLAQRARAGLRQERRPEARDVAQRQLGDDRQVLRRHAGQRRGRHRGGRAQDHRPDRRHLGLVRVLALGRHPPEHQLPRPAQRRGHLHPDGAARPQPPRPARGLRARQRRLQRLGRRRDR